MVYITAEFNDPVFKKGTIKTLLGMLAGKFKRDRKQDPTGSRLRFIQSKKEEGKTTMSNWEEFRNDACFSHGENPKGSRRTVAIRWLLQKSTVVSVITGCTSILEDNMGASGGWEISDDEMKELEEVAPLSKPYPYDLIWGKHGSGRLKRYNRFLNLI